MGGHTSLALYKSPQTQRGLSVKHFSSFASQKWLLVVLLTRLGMDHRRFSEDDFLPFPQIAKEVL